MIRAILTDIEGTTSSLSFVKEVLFPYARERLGDFVRKHGLKPHVRELLGEVGTLAGRPLTDEEVVRQLRIWIDEDRKVTPLKALQGLIWEAGYRSGDFTGHIYPDAAEQLQQWQQQGIRLYVYSSGSVYAQKLLFGHTRFGDLTPLFSGFFDTTSGAKQEAESYRNIATEIARDFAGQPAGDVIDENSHRLDANATLPPESILFLSDIEAELDAAKTAGMKTCWLVRESAPVRLAEHHQVNNFAQISLD